MAVENLNKENFWDDLHKRFPEAVDHFCKWIDDYKQEVGWNNIFKEGVKFHDVPLELQNGIIARYELELFHNAEGKGKEAYEAIAAEYKNHVNSIFQDIQKKNIPTGPNA